MLESTIPSLSDVKEREIGLERLCMIFDKRLPKEKKLKEAIYELLECNRKNIIGLRFLKNNLLQNQDWNELEKVLRELLEIVVHPEEKLRATLDLAALYLYQLGDAEQCLEILGKFENNRIDTSKMRYKAYEFLGKWDECLAILEQSYGKAFDDEEKAAILLLKGKIQFRQDQIKEAYLSFIESAKLTRISLAPAEEALKLAIRLRDIGEVSNILSYLLNKEHWSAESTVRVKFLLERLQQLKKKTHE